MVKCSYTGFYNEVPNWSIDDGKVKYRSANNYYDKNTDNNPNWGSHSNTSSSRQFSSNRRYDLQTSIIIDCWITNAQP